jgi:hypothetical protein
MNYALFHQYRDRERVTEEDLDRWRRFKTDIEARKPVLNLDFEGF